MPPHVEFLYIEEVAQEARVSKDTVRRWIKRGNRQGKKLIVHKPGQRLLVARSDLDTFYAASTTTQRRGRTAQAGGSDRAQRNVAALTAYQEQRGSETVH